MSCRHFLIAGHHFIINAFYLCTFMLLQYKCIGMVTYMYACCYCYTYAHCLSCILHIASSAVHVRTYMHMKMRCAEQHVTCISLHFDYWSIDMLLTPSYIGTEHQSPTPSRPQTAASTHEEGEVWSTVGTSKQHGRVDNVKSTIPHMKDRDDQQYGKGRGGGYHREQKGQPQNSSSVQDPGYQTSCGGNGSSRFYKSNQRGARKDVPSDRYSLTPYEGPPPRSQLAPPNQPPTVPKSPPSAAATFSTGNNICVHDKVQH